MRLNKGEMVFNTISKERFEKTRVVNRYREKEEVYIGRPSKWGNPFIIGRDGNRATVIEKYSKWIRTQPHLLNDLEELRGKRLGCFCAPQPCHGDVLIALLEERI
jgi:hypothetical protein